MIVNIVSFSSTGGAGNVAKTLVHGFRTNGIEARPIFPFKGNLRGSPFANPSLTAQAATDEYLIKSRRWESLISLRRDQNTVLSSKLPEADLTVFRWMNGMLGRRFIALNPSIKNLVWGLDDMNPFTGACHYSGVCRGFELGCDDCPAVRPAFRGLVRRNLQRKVDFVHDYEPTYVAPTDWILREFTRSYLGNQEVIKISNPLQAEFFRRVDEGKKLGGRLRILLVAADLDDPTKGVWDVIDTLQSLSESGKVSITFVGRSSIGLTRRFPNEVFTGSLDSEGVRLQMRSHDVLLVPSLFENAGTVVAEAASQGTPSIARNVGGMPEMTGFGEIGYLFQDSLELKEIVKSLTLAEISNRGSIAKEWAQKFRPSLIASQYVEAFLS